MENSDLIKTLVQIVAYITPYFLIPATFKYGLGVFGNLAGMINDRGRGFFDKQRKKRTESRAATYQGFKTGTGKGAFNWRQNAAVRRAGTSVGAGWEGRYGLGERGAQARSQIAGLAAQEQVMKNPRWTQIQENDDALHALTYGSRSEAVQALTQRFGGDSDRAERAAAAAYTSVGYGRSQALAAAQQLATTGTGYTNLDDQIQTIARASGGDANNAAAIAGYNNFINKQKGRHDLAPGAGDLIAASRAAAEGKVQPKSMQQLTEQSWNSGSLYQIANGKKSATENFANHWKQELKDAAASGDETRLLKAAAAMEEFKSMQPNASGENSNVINSLLNDTEVQAIMGSSLLSSGPRQTVGLDPNDPNKKVYRTTGTSIGDAARKQARAYERPDPHNM